MILVDTSVWVNHLRKTDAELVTNLNMGRVACHPFVIGELACGNLKNRQEILRLFESLPSTPVLEPSEVLNFIEAHKLMGKGLGYIDIHVLASAVLASAKLWTDDKRLEKSAGDLGMNYTR